MEEGMGKHRGGVISVSEKAGRTEGQKDGKGQK
jgi:hypothetical protein